MNNISKIHQVRLVLTITTITSVVLIGLYAFDTLRPFRAEYTTSHSTNSRADKEAITASPFWLTRFSDLASMAKASDLIIIGTVDRVQPGRIASSEDGSHKTPFTNVYIQADKVLTRDGIRDYNKQIILETTGGETNSTVVVVLDSPLYQSGERYLLFLHRKTDDPSLYRTVSPQGRFLIRTRNTIMAASQSSPVYAGNSLDDVVQKTISALQRQ